MPENSKPQWAILWSSIRPAFHWKFSQAIIPLLFGAGVALALDNDFWWAIVVFIFFGMWSICYWLTSDFLVEKRKELSTRKIKKDPERLENVTLSLNRWAWGGSIFIVMVILLCIYLTQVRKSQHIASLRAAERKDTQINLKVTISPAANVSDSVVSIANNGAVAINRLKIVCSVLGLMDENHNLLRGGQSVEMPAPAEELTAGGGTESIPCIARLIRFSAPMKCADMKVTAGYALVTQPDVDETKSARFVARTEEGHAVWYGVAVNHLGSYCP